MIGKSCRLPLRTISWVTNFESIRRFTDYTTRWFGTAFKLTCIEWKTIIQWFRLQQLHVSTGRQTPHKVLWQPLHWSIILHTHCKLFYSTYQKSCWSAINLLSRVWNIMDLFELQSIKKSKRRTLRNAYIWRYYRKQLPWVLPQKLPQQQSYHLGHGTRRSRTTASVWPL